MSDWSSLNYAPTAFASTTYAHTPPKISELPSKRVHIDTPADTLKFFDSTPDLRRIVEYLQESYPVVNKQFRLRCLNGSKATVKGLKVFLLLAAGWTHEAIGNFLNSSRHTVTRINSKLKHGGLIIPSAPNSSKHISQMQPAIKWDRIEVLLKGVLPRLRKNGQVSTIAHQWLYEVIWPLNWSDFRHQSRFEQRTISIGVGGEAERRLDFLLTNRNSKKLGPGTNDASEDGHKGKPSIDRLLESYWNGTFEINQGWRKQLFHCRPQKKRPKCQHS